MVTPDELNEIVESVGKRIARKFDIAVGFRKMFPQHDGKQVVFAKNGRGADAAFSHFEPEIQEGCPGDAEDFAMARCLQVLRKAGMIP